MQNQLSIGSPQINTKKNRKLRTFVLIFCFSTVETGGGGVVRGEFGFHIQRRDDGDPQPQRATDAALQRRQDGLRGETTGHPGKSRKENIIGRKRRICESLHSICFFVHRCASLFRCS